MVTYSLSPRGLKENDPPVRAQSCLRYVKGDGGRGRDEWPMCPPSFSCLPLFCPYHPLPRSLPQKRVRSHSGRGHSLPLLLGSSGSPHRGQRGRCPSSRWTPRPLIKCGFLAQPPSHNLPPILLSSPQTQWPQALRLSPITPHTRVLPSARPKRPSILSDLTLSH